MQKQQKRLGRGLSSLISIPDDSAVPSASTPVKPDEGAPQAMAGQIAVADVRPNPFQPRGEVSDEDIEKLAGSIRQSGVIQPIVVRAADDGKYELVAGERRWRAAKAAGLKQIPAVVRDATNEQMLELALVENIFRQDLNAIDRARAYQRYCREFDMTAEQVAERLGEDRTTVTNYLRLLDLPSEVRDWVAQGSLAMGHARCLLAIKSPSDLVSTARKAMDQGLSVRALEKLVRERVEARELASRQPSGSSDTKRPQIRHLEDAFQRALGTKVEINESRRKGSGRITIHYYSLDDFDRVAEMLGVET